MQNAAVTRGGISPHQLLEDLNAGYRCAMAKGDGPWFKENLAEIFLNSGADVSLHDKTGFIAQVVRPSGNSALTVDDVRLRNIIDIAINQAHVPEGP
jgi:hypothetical protein